jgi:hypothetical protein
MAALPEWDGRIDDVREPRSGDEPMKHLHDRASLPQGPRVASALAVGAALLWSAALALHAATDRFAGEPPAVAVHATVTGAWGTFSVSTDGWTSSATPQPPANARPSRYEEAEARPGSARPHEARS